MYDTILLPIDLAHKEKAKSMIENAKKLGGKKLILLSVVEDIPSYVAANIPDEVIQKLKTEAVTELNEVAKEAGDKATCEVHAGRPATVILEVAEKSGANLIIIGSHRPGFQDYLIGTTAARVVRHANCSVLVLR